MHACHLREQLRRRRTGIFTACRRLALVLALGCNLAPVMAHAEQRIDLLGDRVAAPIGRPVQIGSGTRYVNVEGGEIIRFDVDGKSFSWSFSGPLTVTSFNLMRIAPPGLLDHEVIVYIAPNPNYSGPT